MAAGGSEVPHRPVPAPASFTRSDPTRRLAAVAILAAALVPPAAVGHGPVLCPFRRATGLPCPACGVTRSWVAALHGRPRASIGFHPLGMVALAGAAAYAARLDERVDPALRARASGVWPVLVGGWLGVWALRMVRELRMGNGPAQPSRRERQAVVERRSPVHEALPG